MTSTLLDLSAVALAGIALTGAVLGFAAPGAHMAPAGEPGLGIEMALGGDSTMRTAAVGFGGTAGGAREDRVIWSAPRAF